LAAAKKTKNKTKNKTEPDSFNQPMAQAFSNPVRSRKSRASELYPYYAGFSDAFVADAVRWLDIKSTSTILDPWLGAGTTTRVATNLRVSSIGFDLNPVMVLVAKAELLDRSDGLVLPPLARKIAEYSKTITSRPSDIPLEIFFDRKTAESIRALALAVWLHLVDSEPPISEHSELRNVGPLPAVFLVGLFNVVRGLLAQLSTSNPTWIRTPACPELRISVSRKYVQDAFLAEITRLSQLVLYRPSKTTFDLSTTIAVADSRALPIEKGTIAGILTSPPYCTRLDYGRSTMPELLLLESMGLACYRNSRMRLMGASITRHQDFSSPKPQWGKTCKKLLEQIYSHPSKASKSYYFSSHYSYFADLALSVAEISRVMRKGSRACVVVQDSSYKEIHNDLPKIFAEMAHEAGLDKVGEFAYEKKRSMCRINSASTIYREKRTPVEVALLFRKG
jgi:SAM-dependent methyltransferase